MSKIGLTLAYKGTNYGALLQAYATQFSIERLGHETEIIDYTSGKDRGLILSPLAIGYFGIYKVKSILANKSVIDEDAFHEENKKSRKAIADDFRKRRLKNIVKVIGKNNLINHSKSYDAVLVGSDQLWPPEVGFTYFHTLQFAPTGVRRISYATSMGVSEYPWYVKHADSAFLNKIDYLSVREEQGRKIIKEISGRDAKVVLDPTYLITKDEWETLIPKRRIINEKYVFCFFLGDNPDMKSLARRYASKHNLKVVCIVSNEVSVDDSSYADCLLINQSPEDFINLIRFADCVFTDSFHGFTFSIINQVQVYVSYRVMKGLKSRNSRIDNIVNTFEIPNRLIKNPESGFLPEEKIDYDQVTQILCRKRKESLEFLKDALS